VTVSYVVAGPVLALQVSAGVTGFLTVVLLCLASAGLFVFLSGSLKRMRTNVERGEFGAEAAHGRRGQGRGGAAAKDTSAADTEVQVRIPSQGGADDDGPAK
jgi:hypothetical protein